MSHMSLLSHLLGSAACLLHRSPKREKFACVSRRVSDVSECIEVSVVSHQTVTVCLYLVQS